MEKINEQMYQANIDLVDKNRLLEKDMKNMQKKFDKAVEHTGLCSFRYSTAVLMNILLDGDYND